MKAVTWTTEKRKVSDLIPADYNPRKMTEQEERDLRDSIEEFGRVIPVVVNIGKRSNILIGGHQRTSIYNKDAEIEVMVPSRELTKEEEKKLNLRLNKNTGSWDFEKLKTMDISLLLDVGFGDEELSTLLFVFLFLVLTIGCASFLWGLSEGVLGNMCCIKIFPSNRLDTPSVVLSK